MTKTKPLATTIVMDTQELVGLLVDAAGEDTELPMITGVMLHTDTGKYTNVLVATATNRFMLIQASAPITSGPTGVRQWLTRRQVDGRHAEAGQIEIALDNGACVFRRRELDGVAGRAVRMAVEAGDFPDIEKITARCPVASADPVIIDPRYLARMARLCRCGEALRVETYGKKNPIKFVVSDRLWAIVTTIPGGDCVFDAASVFSIPTRDVTELADGSTTAECPQVAR